jgi:hypothetical protein
MKINHPPGIPGLRHRGTERKQKCKCFAYFPEAEYRFRKIRETLLEGIQGGGGEVLFVVPSPLSSEITPKEVFCDFFGPALRERKNRETFSSLSVFSLCLGASSEAGGKSFFATGGCSVNH